MILILPCAEEIEKIRKGDIKIISKYYLENMDYLRRYVKSFCRRINDFSEFNDYLHEIYLHFEKLSFENERYFGHDCFKVFCNYHYGDQRKRAQLKDGKCSCEEYILDSPVKGMEKEGVTVGDTIAISEDEIFKEENPDISEELYIFLSGFLGKEQTRVFEQFYWTGKTYNEIAETLGKNARTVKRTREEIFKKFRNRKDEIYKFLIANGYNYDIAL